MADTIRYLRQEADADVAHKHLEVELGKRRQCTQRVVHPWVNEHRTQSIQVSRDALSKKRYKH